MDHWSSR